MPSPYTRHGASRAGDDYQDLWGAEILIEFLEHPDRYQWVQFEVDTAGYLDDIHALRVDGSYVSRQIKFTVDPEDTKYEVSWHYLLDRKPGKRGLRPSLLQKWAHSLSNLKETGKVYEAALYTNRQSAAEVKRLLMRDGSGRIDFEAISDAEVLHKMYDQLGGADRDREFFSEFRFYVDKPHPTTVEDGLKRRLFKLSGDDRGWYNLLSEIRH